MSIRAIISLALLCLLCACGKAGLPDPGDPSKSFAWKSYEAKPIGNCLAFSGVLSGAYNNLDSLRLELEPVDGPEDCPGCPFVARDIVEFSPREAGLERTTGNISFSYCPNPAPAFRWRLVGLNVYTSLPYAATSVWLTTIVEPASPAAPKK